MKVQHSSRSHPKGDGFTVMASFRHAFLGNWQWRCARMGGQLDLDYFNALSPEARLGRVTRDPELHAGVGLVLKSAHASPQH